MKPALAWAIAVSVSSSALGSTTNDDPISKVVGMIQKLQNEILKEGGEEQKMYNEFARMCQTRSAELHREVKTNKGKLADETAIIEKCTADSAQLQEKISEKAAAISDAENELKKATAIRKRENDDFKAEEKSLRETISSIERSIAIIEKGTSGGASLAQVEQERMQSIASVFDAMIEASAFNQYDQEKLTSLVQSEDKDSDSDEDEQMGAPSAAAYKAQSGTITETLGALLEKAQKALDDARQAETASKASFELQRQSLQDKGKTLNKELAEAKKTLAQTREEKATSQGEKENVRKDLEEGEKELSTLHQECLDKANSFEESASSRAEELKALAEVKKIISSSTGDAGKRTYGLSQVSFLQVKSRSAQSESARALHVVRQFALAHRSEVFGKLATNIASVIKLSSMNGADPFVKVKRMIQNMVEKLEEKAEDGATKQAYCDKAMSETSAKKEDKEDTIEKQTIQIEVAAAKSKNLKADVARLQKELTSISNSQAEMDSLRMKEKALFNKDLPAMTQGLEAVKSALKILREYYSQDDGAGDSGEGHSASEGAASGIIGMLEVVESDFSKGIAAMTSEEESAVAEYDAATKENQLAKASKEQDVKYKTAEFLGLDKTITEIKTDRTGSQEELAAINQYFASVKKECVAKADSYAERKKRRDDEIANLREALQAMAPSFLQQSMVHKTLRGAEARPH